MREVRVTCDSCGNEIRGVGYWILKKFNTNNKNEISLIQYNELGVDYIKSFDSVFCKKCGKRINKEITKFSDGIKNGKV